MNKMIRTLVTAILLIPALATADGYHVNGTVYVFPGASFQGSMNVRYNTAISGLPFIYATGYAGGHVTFAARDAENEYMSCIVSTSNPLYAEAVEIKNNLKHGSRLYVVKSSSSNECSNVFLGNYSYYLE